MDKKRLFLYVFFVVVLFGGGIYLLKTDKTKLILPTYNFPSVTITPIQTTASQSAELVVVKRVIDGDTIELSDGRKVRYIGVDTPELATLTKEFECFAKEAKEKNKELMEGKTITMKKDVSETDKYKRLLRYVWVGEIFVNEYLAREGYARQATYPPDVAYVELFRTAVKEAKNNNKGLWNTCK